MSKPYIPNLEPLIGAGIDPKTGLPIKLTGGCTTHLKEDINRMLSIVDRQDAINRFTWSGLEGTGLTGELIERILYHKGQGIFFKCRDERFYFLPYTLAGSIDMYGRFLQVTPLTLGTDATPFIKGLIKLPVYDVDETVDPDDACVIIRDYSNDLSQTIISREIINRSIVSLESECIPLLRTALINSTGVQGLRVNTEDERDTVLAQSMATDNAALTGQKYVPIIGSLDFQDLTSGNVAQVSEFLQTMQSLDNLRLQCLGIENGGVFTKKEHILQEEQDLNSGSDSITMKDALKQREDACEKINNVFGLNISVSPNEPTNEEEMEVEEDGV